MADRGGLPPRPRPGRGWARVASAVVALLVAATGCGRPHALIEPAGVVAAEDSPLAPITVERAGARSRLPEVLVPEVRTAVVVVAGPCEPCGPLLSELRDAAFGAEPFSVVALSLGAPAPDLTAAAQAAGVDLWVTRGAPDRTTALLEVSALGGVTILSPVGRVVRSWQALPRAATVAAVARR